MAKQSQDPPVTPQSPEPKSCDKPDRYAAWERAGITARHIEPRQGGPAGWSKAVDSLCDGLGSGFIVALLGQRGTGKTQIGAEVMRYHTAGSEAFTGLYVLATEIAMAIRATYGGDGDEREMIARYLLPQFLIIDELHERSESKWENQLFTYIIDKRYGQMKDTLIISNLNHEDFEQCAGASIYSRITETGGIINCEWESFRK